MVVTPVMLKVPVVGGGGGGAASGLHREPQRGAGRQSPGSVAVMVIE